MKSKRFIKIASLALATVLTFGMVACNDDAGDDKGSSNYTPATQKCVYDGVHDFTATDTANYLVKGGLTDYVVVYPEDTKPYEMTAVNELVYFFNEATGIILNAYKDSEVSSFGQSSKYLSVGYTLQLSAAGIDHKAEKTSLNLGNDGVRVKTVGNSVFMYGGGETGTLYAVYDFLNVTFDYECYYADTFVINRNVSDVALKNYNVTDIPDIPIRWSNYGDTTSNDTFRNRFRYAKHHNQQELPIYEDITEGENSIANSRSEVAHNAMEYFPLGEGKAYGWHDNYPEVYSNTSTKDKEQLCYEGRGLEFTTENGNYDLGYYTPNAYVMYGVNNAEDLSEDQPLEPIHFDTLRDMMIYAAAEKIEASLRYNDPIRFPQYDAVTLTMEDNHNTCKCSVCRESYEKYGNCWVASVIKFCNEVNKYVKEWMEKNPDYAREDFKIIFFSYHDYLDAPVVKNEKGEYEPIAPEVKLDEGVAVFQSVNGTVCYQKSIYADENAGVRENCTKWTALADTIWYWTYSTNFHQYMYMSDTFSFYGGEGYAFFACNNAGGLYNNAQNQGKMHTAFHTLKLYLDQKLMWNTSLNEEELIEDFFENMYLEAAPYMRRLFDLERAQFHYVCDTYGLYVTNINSVNVDIARAKYWPKQLLEGYIDLCNEAYAAVEKYNRKSTSELYTALVKHIDAEYVSPAYILLTLHKDELSNYDAFKDDFKEKIAFIGLTNSSEHEAMAID